VQQIKELYLEADNHSGDFEWEDTCEDLFNLMEEINPSRRWTAQVEGFGWRGIDGKIPEPFECQSGQDLLFKILPETMCTFKVYREGNRILIDNAHHDKPCGGEWYTVEVAND
jgi:hypothetical protein